MRGIGEDGLQGPQQSRRFALTSGLKMARHALKCRMVEREAFRKGERAVILIAPRGFVKLGGPADLL